MSDTDKIETKPAIGQGHPAQCWGWWDSKAKECSGCVVSDKCADATRRLSNKGTPVPLASTVPSPAAPVAKTIVKPKSIQAPKVEAPPAAPAKVEVPAAPVIASEPEVDHEPEVKLPPPPTGDRIPDLILPRIGGTFVKNDSDKLTQYKFVDGAGKPLFMVGVNKEAKKAKLMAPTGASKIIDLGATDEDICAALDALL